MLWKDWRQRQFADGGVVGERLQRQFEDGGVVGERLQRQLSKLRGWANTLIPLLQPLHALPPLLQSGLNRVFFDSQHGTTLFSYTYNKELDEYIAQTLIDIKEILAAGGRENFFSSEDYL